jgi:hypothetical protein
MDDQVDTIESTPEALAISNVTDEEADPWVMVELGRKVVLLELVATEYRNSGGIMFGKQVAHKAFAE